MAKLKSKKSEGDFGVMNDGRDTATSGTSAEHGEALDESKDNQFGNGFDDQVEIVEMTNEHGQPVLEEEEEEEEDEDIFDMGLTTLDAASTNYLRNTPLLYATQAGHRRVVWLLLVDGYSPNDVDKMENNAIHLAAAYGDVKLLKLLVDAGGNCNVVNFYKNLPIDMAKNKEVRDFLRQEMVLGASLTEEDRVNKQDQQLRSYQRMTQVLVQAITEARQWTSGMDNQINRMLSDAIVLGRENALDQSMIDEAEALLLKIEVDQALTADIKSVTALSPITTQTAYLQHVYRLERSIERATEVGVDSLRVRKGLIVIQRCQCEHWLSLWISRLADVATASDAYEHDMNKLRSALSKAQEVNADESMIEKAGKFLGRLDAELGMYRALKAIPPIKLPLENAPEGYYGEDDVGKIKQTEEYPLPFVETGDYIWLPAENLSKFSEAINRLRTVYQGAEALGANPQIIAESKERLTKSEKELKLLEAKDNNDKFLAIEAAKKAAKKLKKPKKKK
jgi:hypothetical protein